ncbi:MAG: DUF624 domain-containing protein [Clostridia bacterium]|nr:DUF624 domain-containing protein [Clostridia bacterium]
MATKKKHKLFDFFNYHRDNRVDALEEDTTPTIKRYFKLLGRRFWKLITLNMMMLPMIAPILIALYIWFGVDRTPTVTSGLFPQIFAANQLSPSPESTILLDLYGMQSTIPVYNATPAYIGVAICALVLLVTFGWQNAGATYVLRSMVRGEPVFVWSDYFYAVKRNLKQGLLLGILDFVVIFLLAFDIGYFWNQAGTSFLTNVGFWLTCLIIILYFLMRFYMYLLMITFDLSIRKILKNALIFAVLGFKRNIMAVLGILLITAVNVALLLLLGPTPLGGVPIILPFLYYLSVTAFTAAYGAYPIIERYMIKPYLKAEDEEAEEVVSEEE